MEPPCSLNVSGCPGIVVISVFRECAPKIHREALATTETSLGEPRRVPEGHLKLIPRPWWSLGACRPVSGCRLLVSGRASRSPVRKGVCEGSGCPGLSRMSPERARMCHWKSKTRVYGVHGPVHRKSKTRVYGPMQCKKSKARVYGPVQCKKVRHGFMGPYRARKDRSCAEEAVSLGMPRSCDEGNELWGRVPMYPEESGIKVCRGSRLCCTFSLVGFSPQLEVATCYMNQSRVRQGKDASQGS
ncbi:hypothetical protein CRG98_001219 [Punica granatum]|uniref:Uncharacterized protein n=1 Tax=Punica granatum TaxID=22663 RepID=A0A2I0LCJ3_PUNGR|nr:hypothetical protein CRG98_001219 [Punica granatum]